MEDHFDYLSGFTKDDKRKPVIPLMIYWGTDEWDAPRSLKEMFGDIDESILKFVRICTKFTEKFILYFGNGSLGVR